MLSGGHRTSNGLPEDVGALLESASEILGAAIRLDSGAVEQSFGRISQPDCKICRLRGAEGSRECSARRDLMLRMVGNPSEYEHWVGPCGCEVTVVALPASPGTPLRLIAIRPPHANGDSSNGGAQSLRFLVRLAHLVSEHLTMRMEMARTAVTLAHTREELGLLTTISGRLGEERDMRQAVQRVLSQSCRAVGADAAIVFIPERRLLEVVTGETADPRLSSSSRTWRRLAERVAAHFRQQNRRFFAGTQLELGPGEPLFHQDKGQILALSLPTQSDVLGVLCLVHLNGSLLRRESEVKLLESVSERVGMAISNHDLYENLKDFQIATVRSLVSAIEAKDPYTSGHSERVHILSMLLGKALGLAGEDLEVLKWASILHDIGKIGMPEMILRKPGKLTSEEYDIMKEHPERGYRVLSPIQQLAAASLAVRSHHERMDGRGYPMGLRAEEIPRIARIISVADTYDALTSTRAYRPRRGPDEAFAVIEDVKGTQLDPDVVDALAELLPFIREHEVMIQSGALEQTPLIVEEPEAKAA
jgi:HD-GYP domain-containing protein (c-di-GMP phosphodiesterase class II)